MSFDPATIRDVRQTREPTGSSVVSWSSSLPAGTVFQAYLDGRQIYRGVARSFRLPPQVRRRQLLIGAVAAADRSADFSAALPSPTGASDVALLEWLGGRYLALDLRGFHVYGEATPGAGIDYGKILGDVPAFPAGVYADGYGCGPYGAGTYRYAAKAYSWRSGRLPRAGTWNFGVKPYDSSGQHGTAVTYAVAVAVPPSTPAGGLAYTYNPATGVAVLTWGAAAAAWAPETSELPTGGATLP